VLTLSGVNDVSLDGTLYNSDLFRHTSSGRLGVTAGSRFKNLSSATYRMESDATLFQNSCCAAAALENWGTFLKTGTTGSVSVTLLFNNLEGTIQVESGALVLANNGTSSNATVNVAAGAMLDLTGNSSPTWAGRFSGTGGGRIQLSSGTLNANPALTLDCAADLFQWTGGRIAGTLTNAGVMTISGTSDVICQGAFYNAATMRQTGAGAFGLIAGSTFANLATGTYEFAADSGLFIASCCTAPAFNNFGLVRRYTSSGVAAITFLSTTTPAPCRRKAARWRFLPSRKPAA